MPVTQQTLDILLVEYAKWMPAVQHLSRGLNFTFANIPKTNQLKEVTHSMSASTVQITSCREPQNHNTLTGPVVRPRLGCAAAAALPVMPSP
jgi:hypothetical protein